MGTTAEVLLYAPSREAAQPLFDAAFDEIERIEQLLSDYRPTSELSRLNDATGAVTLDPEMARLWNRVMGWARQSGGAFDPTVGALVDVWGFRSDSLVVPSDSVRQAALARVGWTEVQLDLLDRTLSKPAGMRLDAGGFGKGYALDRAATVLKDAGVSVALLGFGGSSYLALGAPPNQGGWLIHVDDPTPNGEHTASVLLRDQALSTSGPANHQFEVDGAVYGHLLDPRTGEPSDASVQATVLATNAMDADVLSTAVFVLGPEGAESFLAGIPGTQAWILHDSAEGTRVRTIRWSSH